MGYLFVCPECFKGRISYLPCNCIFLPMMSAIESMVGWTLVEYTLWKGCMSSGPLLRFSRENYPDKYLMINQWSMVDDDTKVPETICELSVDEYKDLRTSTEEIERTGQAGSTKQMSKYYFET